jgi:hypothetical protein
LRAIGRSSRRRVVSGRAEAEVEAGRGSAKDGLAVFDRSFEPLWPAELVKSYYNLLVEQATDAQDARCAAGQACGQSLMAELML